MNSIGGPERVFAGPIFAYERTAINTGAKIDRITPG